MSKSILIFDVSTLKDLNTSFIFDKAVRIVLILNDNQDLMKYEIIYQLIFTDWFRNNYNFKNAI